MSDRFGIETIEGIQLLLPESKNHGKDLSIAYKSDMEGQPCTPGHTQLRDGCIPNRVDPTSSHSSVANRTSTYTPEQIVEFRNQIPRHKIDQFDEVIAAHESEQVKKKPEKIHPRIKELIKQSDKIQITDDVVNAPSIGTSDYEEIERVMTGRERERLEEDVRESVMNDIGYGFETNIDRDETSESEFSQREIYKHAQNLIKFHATDMSADLEAAVTEALDNWHDSDNGGGEYATRQISDALEEFIDALPNGFIKDWKKYQNEVSERTDEAVRELEEAEQEKAMEEAMENYDDSDIRRQLLSEFYNNHQNEPRFAREITPDVWGKNDENDFSYNFETGSGNGYEITVYKKHIGIIGIAHTLQFADASGSYSVTGAGGAVEVFSKVTAAVVSLMNGHDIPILTYTAEEKSRQKLYDRLTKTVLNAMPDYDGIFVPSDPKRYIIAKRDVMDKLKAKFMKPEKSFDPEKPYEEITPEIEDEWFTEEGWEEDVIPGGLADDVPASKFDPKLLSEGIKVEMEHTSDPDIAREIAKDHLMEDLQYYRKLRKVEGKDLSVKSMDDIVGGYGGRKRAFVSKDGHLLGYVDKDDDFHSYDIELTKWMIEGVRGQSSMRKDGVIYEIEKTIMPDDPLYPLYLMEALNKAGVRVYSGKSAQNLQIQKSLDSYHFKGRLPAAPKAPKQDLHGKPCGIGQNAERDGCIPNDGQSQTQQAQQDDTYIPNDSFTIENGDDPSAGKPLNMLTPEERAAYKVAYQQAMQAMTQKPDKYSDLGLSQEYVDILRRMSNKPLSSMTDEEAEAYEAWEDAKYGNIDSSVPVISEASIYGDIPKERADILDKIGITPNLLPKLHNAVKNPRKYSSRLNNILSKILTHNLMLKNAVLELDLMDGGENSYLSSIFIDGDIEEAEAGYEGLPKSDIRMISSLEIMLDDEFDSLSEGHKNGAAVCDMNSGSIIMREGNETETYIHELGHAIHAAYGDGGIFNKTLKTLFKESQSKLKGKNIKDALEGDFEGAEFPGAYGMQDPEEYFAEHFRLYHEAIKNNSMKETFKEELGDVGDEDYLDTYRKENPKMSKLMDAHYTIALLAQKQNKSGTKFMEYKPRSMNYIGKDLSIAAYKDMSGQECTIGHNAARDNCIPKKKEPTSKKPSKQKEQVSSDYSTESDTDAIPEKQRAKAGKLVSARREGKGKDAVVILHGGKPAPEHIKPSMIPPAWKKVRVSLDPEADVLVTARDAKGRVKTVYHERFIANNQAAKFAKIQEGLKKFEQLSDEIQKDRSNPEFKEFADCAWLMQEQATRPGSDADTKGFEHLYGKKLTADDFLIKYDKKGKASIALQIGEEKIPMKDEGSREEILRRIKEGEDLDDSTYWLKSFGATTLEDRHVVETVDGVRLRFQGKEGVFHDHLIKNPELASMLLDRKKTAGDRDGKIFNTDYLGVSSYVKKLDGGMFTPKDLRTMRATSMAIAEIKKMGDCCKTPEEYEQRVMEVAEKVSHVLGNRAEQCLLSYISPTVWSVWKNPEPEESDDAVALAYEVPKPPKLENPSDAEKQMIQDLLKMATWKTSDPRIIPITRPMGEITNKPGPNQKKITAFRLKLVKWRRENAEHFVEKKSLGMWTKGLDLSVKEEESTNDIPGLDADIYFGDPSIPLPNWREVLPEEDDDSDEISDEERDAVERMIGFGSDDSDDDDSPYMPEIRPSPFDKHGKDLLNEDDMNKALPKTKKEPKLKVDLTGKPCGRGQSAARTHCKPKEKPAPRKPRATNPAVAKPIDKKPALVKPAVQKPVTVATKPATKKTIQPKKYTVAESDKLARSFYDKFAKSVLGSNAEKLQLDSLRDMLSRSTNAAIEFMGHNVFRISAHGKKSVMIDQIINGMQAAKKANQKPVVYDMEKIVPKPAPFKSMDDVINYLVSLSPKLDAMAQMKSKVENLTKKAKEIFNSANKEEVDKKLQMYEQRIKFINKVSQDFSKKVRDRLVEGLIVHSWSPPATDVNSFKKQMTKLFKNREGFDIDKAMAKFTPALEFINKAVRRSTHSNFKIVEASDKRSFYKKASVDGTRATIGVDPDFTEDYTFVHEVGHHLECNVPGLREAAVAFVKRRTAKSPNRKLKDLFPKAHYSDSETGNQDDFAKTFGESSSWYVGKTYALTDKGKKKEFTEIVSMGLQHLYTDPVGFAKSDPEYCALIINAMRGKV